MTTTESEDAGIVKLIYNTQNKYSVFELIKNSIGLLIWPELPVLNNEKKVKAKDSETCACCGKIFDVKNSDFKVCAYRGELFDSEDLKNESTEVKESDSENLLGDVEVADGNEVSDDFKNETIDVQEDDSDQNSEKDNDNESTQNKESISEKSPVAAGAKDDGEVSDDFINEAKDVQENDSEESSEKNECKEQFIGDYNDEHSPDIKVEENNAMQSGETHSMDIKAEIEEKLFAEKFEGVFKRKIIVERPDLECEYLTND